MSLTRTLPWSRLPTINTSTGSIRPSLSLIFSFLHRIGNSLSSSFLSSSVNFTFFTFFTALFNFRPVLQDTLDLSIILFTTAIMKYEAATIFVSVLSLAQAVPVPEARNKFVPTYRLRGREVPQEHSHNTFLDGVRVNLALSNTAKLGDPVFGLLGNAAIIAGNALGTTTNPDCLHQAIADQAFTNAKAAQNVSGMVDALSYQALERNTAGVGVVSVSCNETAVNPEIAAVQQHQDPASSGAAATNKAIVLALAAQISAVGGDPQDALKTGTFAPGTVSSSSLLTRISLTLTDW